MLSVFNSALLEADQPVPGAAAAAAAVQARFMLTVKVTRKKKTLAGNKRGERLWHSSCGGQTTSSESRKMLPMRKRPILSARDKESVQFDGDDGAAAPHLQPVFIQTALGPIRLQMQSEDDF